MRVSIYMYCKMDVSHSVCFNVAFDISKKKYYLVGDKLLSVIKHGFLRSEENVNLNDFQCLMVYECSCVL